MTDIYQLSTQPLIALCGLSRAGKGYFTKQELISTYFRKFHVIAYFNPSYYDEIHIQDINWEQPGAYLYTEITVELIVKVG